MQLTVLLGPILHVLPSRRRVTPRWSLAIWLTWSRRRSCHDIAPLRGNVVYPLDNGRRPGALYDLFAKVWRYAHGSEPVVVDIRDVVKEGVEMYGGELGRAERFPRAPFAPDSLLC